MNYLYCLSIMFFNITQITEYIAPNNNYFLQRIILIGIIAVIGYFVGFLVQSFEVLRMQGRVFYNT